MATDQSEEDAPPAGPPIRFSPQSDLLPGQFNYLAGFRYEIGPANATLAGIADGRFIYIGIGLDLGPTFVRKDPAQKALPKKLKTGTSDSISGRGSGVKVINESGRFITSLFVPHLEMLRDGRFAHHKAVLIGAKPIDSPETRARKANTQSDQSEARNRRSTALLQSQNAMMGEPLLFPSHDGWNGTGKHIHPKYLPTGPDYPMFALPIFRIQEDTIPERVVKLMAKWIASHPHDLLYPQVAYQKVLQWLWVVRDDELRVERFDKRPVGTKVPYVALSDWLKCAHLYEAYHQHHQLVWYIHPFRFTHHIMRGKGTPKAATTKLSRVPQRYIEEMIVYLLPLSQHSLGKVIPSSFRGSSMPDLAALQPEWGVLSRSNSQLATSNQPDWRSLYFPSMPFWDSLFQNNNRLAKIVWESNLHRAMWIPASWIPTTKDKVLTPTQNSPPFGVESHNTDDDNCTILDRRPGENDNRESPLVGPTPLNGAATPSNSVINRARHLKRWFRKHGPIWAARPPPDSEYPVMMTEKDRRRDVKRWKMVDVSTGTVLDLPPKPPGQAEAAQAGDESDGGGAESVVLSDSDSGEDTPPPAASSSRKNPPVSQDNPHQSSRRIIPAPLPSTEVPVPEGSLSWSSSDLWGPTCVNWFYLQNQSRLNQAIAAGMPLDELSFSRTTGLVVFPGLDDENALPTEVSPAETGQPDPVVRALWEELAEAGPCWSSLWDRVSLWCSGSHPISDSEITREAASALELYLTHAVPLHLAYMLSPDKADNHSWMKGSAGTGLVDMNMLEESITWMGGGSADAEESAIVVTSLWERSSVRAKQRLLDFVKSVRGVAIPRILRHLFAADEKMVAHFADTVLTKCGYYQELNFNYLIPPLQKDGQTDNSSGGERPAKRQRVENGGELVQFWEEPSEDVLLEAQLGLV